MQLETKQEKKLARPLQVLVPLIKADLKEMALAAEAATLGYRIQVGGKLMEAKGQLSAIQWRDWLKKNFHLGQAQASAYMRAAVKDAAGEKHRTMSHYSGDFRPSHESPWSQDVKNFAKATRTQMASLSGKNGDEDGIAISALCNKIIDIGYRVLSVELHPDKKGGSEESMRRLNAARARLREGV